MARFDIAITSYQYARYLWESANSVLTQDYRDLRLLIIDNASTDGSQQVAKDIAASDDRVSLILNEENRGFQNSFNRAIDWAQADYLIILDADDLLAPGALSYAAAFLDKNPSVALAYGTEGRLISDRLDPGRSDPMFPRWHVVDGQDFIRRTCWDSFCDIGAPAVVRRTSAQKAAGHYRSELVRTCDFEIYLRLGLVGRVASTNKMLGIRRMHESQLSAPYNRRPLLDFIEHEAAFANFFKNEGRELADSARLQEMARVKLGEYAYWHGVADLLRGDSNASEQFAFAAERRGVSLPPLVFLMKQRWLRSFWRAVRRQVMSPLPPPRYPRQSERPVREGLSMPASLPEASC
jgi:glycosyltransferase involved in cell wall biosynthesis